MRARSFGVGAALVAIATVASYGAPESTTCDEASAALVQSPQARDRIDALRERFHEMKRGVAHMPSVEPRQPVATNEGPKTYRPEVGQKGKDVVWVPTDDTVVEKMLEIARVRPSDLVIDLGSGDGRTVIGAAKRGARSLGIEYEPELVELSKRAARRDGVADKARFMTADLFETDLSKATVITMFLLPEINLELRPKILQLRPGTRIVSNTFTMGDWTADDSVTVEGSCSTHCTALLWVVPARVDGVWKSSEGKLELDQEFQYVTGTLSANGVDTPLQGRVRGDHITFTAGEAQYSGRVSGNSIAIMKSSSTDGRERFRLTRRRDAAAWGKPPAAARDAKPPSVIGAGIATGFEPSHVDRESIRALVAQEAKRGVARTASVELPRVASGFVRLEDDASHLNVRFALRETKDAPIAVADGIALYADALPGADIVHRVHAEGTEDFVVFEERPAREELRYAVDVSGVAGLRLVSNTLEFLDDTGTPRLRIAPPYVVDADGEQREAMLAVEGCAADVNPSAPWGRPVTKPGATQCTVLVAWQGVAYPAVVDPAWTATGSMVHGRTGHTASVIGKGNVLVVGGNTTDFVDGGGGCIPTAELYNFAAGTFSATGSMATERCSLTASVLRSGNVLVTGGLWNGPKSLEPLATAEIYDPAAGTFSPTGSMAGARSKHTATVLGSGKVLVAGGANSTVAELYDPVAGAFSATGSMGGQRSGHTATILGSGNVLVAGGSNNATAELYDPAAGAFSATGSMAQARVDHTASVLASGAVLVAGGRVNSTDSGALATAELYDPAVGVFSATGSMTDARTSHTATVLGSGIVLVAGGVSANAFFAPLPTAELYDAAAGTFSAIDSMATARAGHSASALASGEVLVAGGPDASAELLSQPVDVGPKDDESGGGGGGGGCGCRVRGQGSPGTSLAVGVLVLAALLLRRRRFRRR